MTPTDKLADALRGEIRSNIESCIGVLQERLQSLEALAEHDAQPVPGESDHATCPVAPHTGNGYLHAPEHMGPYDVDGVTYCGRCHAFISPQPAPAPVQVDGFDFLAHLQRQREWSERTFGPGARTAGVIDHIRKELREIEADPADVSEWIDVVILALDGAWRAGFQPTQIIDALVAKQTRNEGRTWPDWRTMPADKAVEHDRSADAHPPAPAADGAGAASVMLPQRILTLLATYELAAIEHGRSGNAKSARATNNAGASLRAAIAALRQAVPDAVLESARALAAEYRRECSSKGCSYTSGFADAIEYIASQQEEK